MLEKLEKLFPEEKKEDLFASLLNVARDFDIGNINTWEVNLEDIKKDLEDKLKDVKDLHYYTPLVEDEVYLREEFFIKDTISDELDHLTFGNFIDQEELVQKVMNYWDVFADYYEIFFENKFYYLPL